MDNSPLSQWKLSACHRIHSERDLECLFTCGGLLSEMTMTIDLLHFLRHAFCVFAALVSRQFVDMTRIRIEGLLAAFPKLVGIGKQHTYVETENVRYVYQPMEQLYLLLVTNRQSNILDDLETLRLLSKIVSFVLW